MQVQCHSVFQMVSARHYVPATESLDTPPEMRGVAVLLSAHSLNLTSWRIRAGVKRRAPTPIAQNGNCPGGTTRC